MAKMDITVRCSICGAKEEREIILPGWGGHLCADEERGLCPEHTDIDPFIESHCYTCVAGWADRSCPLYKKFAYGKFDITREELDVICSGSCPYRVNGLMVVEYGTITDLDTSSPAVKAGRALAKALEKIAEELDSDKQGGE